MSTWFDEAARIIDGVHRSLPADADLASRKRALRAARPTGFCTTSWGRKVWQKAQRQYLAKFGQKPRGAAKLPMSPLERLIQRQERVTRLREAMLLPSKKDGQP